jgi:hypothetical protein
MAWVEGNLATRRPWKRLGVEMALIAVLVGEVVFAALDVGARTMPSQRSETGALDVSLALPCRHQMALSKKAPACAAAPTAGMNTADSIAPRKPHGFGSHPKCAKNLWLRRQGWFCSGPLPRVRANR